MLREEAGREDMEFWWTAGGGRGMNSAGLVGEKSRRAGKRWCKDKEKGKEEGPTGLDQAWLDESP